MIRAGMVWTVARAEMRLTRRLVRYWIFQGLAALAGVAVLLYYGFLHRAFSSWSGTAAMLNPRYLIGFLGIYYILLFCFGLVFLGYDVRARDRRERMVEVLDAAPLSNLELMLGRFLGILLPSWFPVVAICGLMLVLGLALDFQMEPYSFVTFAVFLVTPAYVFSLGLVFLLTMLLRHRLVVAIAALAVLVGLIVINFGFVPIYLLPLVDLSGGFSIEGVSDLTPGIIDPRGFLQRVGLTLVGLALVFLATALHPRRDDGSRPATAGIGALLLVAGLAAGGFLVWEALAAIRTTETWKEAHGARRDDPAPDLLAIRGDVGLDPGRDLRMELEVRFRARPGRPLENALFTLNPGLEVRAIATEEGAPLEFEHANGLLEVRLDRPLAGGAATSLRMEIGGVPDPTFGYLDSVFQPLSLNIREGNVFILGFWNLIYDRDFVVLLPGVRWLPASGAEIGRGDPRGRPRDFFTVDLDVELPAGWLVAGPGRRREADEAAGDGRARFRFAPPAPLPEVALVAGPLESRSTEIEGVTLEVLIHRAHAGNLEVFADATGEIRDWLSERLAEAAELGIDYPYDGLTLVEVPVQLRGYAGGWRMDTTFTQPAMVMMRESGFPTAEFAKKFADPDDFRDHEGGIARAKRETLERFFENDFSGGNPFIAASRSFFSYQTSGMGPEGLPMDYICEDMTTRLVTDKQGYFSVHHFGKDLNTTINQTVMSILNNRDQSVSDALITTVTARSDVWDQVLDVELTALDPWEAPKRALDVLTLKGGAMSRSMLDDLGHAKSGQFLAALRRRTAGEAFDREDILAAGEEIDVDLESWLDVWLGQTALPGFVVAKVGYDRIEDGEDGAPRYQALVTIRNGESTPGLLRLEYVLESEDGDRRAKPDRTDPIRVEGDGAVEVGIVSSRRLRNLRVVPYLALNRQGFNVPLPAIDEERIVDEEPFRGVREVDWAPADDGSITVDDLDEGFSVVEAESRSALRVGGKGVKDEDTDQGLPIEQPGRPSSRWSRVTASSAWGEYRHTMARIRAGDAQKRAIFTAAMPRAGQWELQYHVPESLISGFASGRRRGSWNLKLVDSSGSQTIDFDAQQAEGGWNSLGTFEVAAGEARVEVSAEAGDKGRYVVADAIRWVPRDRPSAAEAVR